MIFLHSPDYPKDIHRPQIDSESVTSFLGLKMYTFFTNTIESKYMFWLFILCNGILFRLCQKIK